MKVLIPFTSGFDSTYTIITAMQMGHDVTLYNHELLNNKNLTKIETELRSRLFPELQKMAKIFGVSLHNMNNGSKVEIGVGERSDWLFQAPVFVQLTAFVAIGFDEVWLGYKQNDYAVSFIPEMNAIWDNIFEFQTEAKKPTLRFPLIKLDRSRIVHKLLELERNWDVKLTENINTCETGEIGCDYCGSCESLKKVNRIMFEQHTERNKEILKDTEEMKIFKAFKSNTQLFVDVDVTEIKSVESVNLTFKVHRDELE